MQGEGVQRHGAHPAAVAWPRRQDLQSRLEMSQSSEMLRSDSLAQGFCPIKKKPD